MIPSIEVNSEFSHGLEGWEYHQVPNTDANTQHCDAHNTNAYYLRHSIEHGGSAFVGYTNNCWLGLAGAIKTFTIPANHDGGALILSLDYRSLASSIHSSGGGHVNNIAYLVSDSSGNEIQRETIYQGEKSSGLRDTGWRSYITIIPSISASQCPCTIFVYTYDGWLAEWQKSIYFDNLTITVYSPV